MKKIVSILFVALIALAFMGCPTTYDTNYPLTVIVGDIVGDFSGVLTGGGADTGVEPVNNGDGTYSVTFAYRDDMISWNGGDGKCSFKMRTVANDWGAPSYGIGETPVELGGDFVPVYSTSPDNITVEGLIDGNTYTITFKVSGDQVSVKVSE